MGLEWGSKGFIHGLGTYATRGIRLSWRLWSIQQIGRGERGTVYG